MRACHSRTRPPLPTQEWLTSVAGAPAQAARADEADAQVWRQGVRYSVRKDVRLQAGQLR